ncbi:PAS domain S-box protein [Flavobacterium sp. LB2R40]|uniref:PAS domain-containing sensor histidine kinase n=1 Tax=unclassified Flavobacterium TaxID=196869 RepID=UPI003AADFCAE
MFNNKNFQQELSPLLSFIAELCKVPFVAITLTNTDTPTFIAKTGLDYTSTIPKGLQLYNEEIIRKKSICIFPDINEDPTNKIAKKTILDDFSFLAGLPISNNNMDCIGTLCIMDSNAKELSETELKTLDYSVSQIQATIKLWQQNYILEKEINAKETQFQIFIDNSKEIIYEINSDGIITYVSTNWTTHLGHQPDEIIGKKSFLLMHPDDVEMVNTFFNTIDSTQILNEITYRILHKDGHYVWHATSIILSVKEGEKIYRGNCRDITEYIEALQKIVVQKEFYEKILDRLPTDVAVFDSNYRYTYLNSSAIKNDELRKYIIGKNDFEYAKHTGRDDTFAKSRRLKFLQALKSKNLIEWEDSIESLNGQKTYHTRKLTPVFKEDGTLEMMVGFGVDITESKSIQEEILKSRQLTQSIIQNVAVGILVQGPQSEILENNKAACEMLGVTEDQLLGRTSYDDHWKVIHLNGSTFTADQYPVSQAIKKLKPINNIVMGIHRPMYNDLVWLLVDAIPVFGDCAELLSVICSFNDITALKNAEDALKISNERFIYSGEATSDALWDWNIATDEIFVGGSYCDLFGHQFENNIIKRQEYENFLHSEDKVSYLESLTKALISNTHKWSFKYRYLKSDGTYAYVSDKVVIIRNEEGIAIRIIGAMQDITNEKKLKDELQQSEEQFKGAFENSAVGMALVTQAGYYKEVNYRLCKMLGYSKKEMKFLTFQEITYFKDLEIDLKYKEQLDSGKIANFSSEKRFLHHDKSIVWAQMFVSLAKNDKNEIKHYIIQIIDITKKKTIEFENKLLIIENNRNKNNQLKEAKSMYRLLADNTVDLVCLHNSNTIFEYISPSIKKLLGYTPEELIGKSPLDYVHPENLKELLEKFYNFIEKKNDESVQCRFLTKEGDYKWLETKASIITDNGLTIGFQSSSRDITQQKEAEEIIINTLTRERELNELRTNLVSTISHEFRTPMTTIRTSAELISMYLENQNLVNGERLQKRVTIITEEIDRIVELMNAVLTISKEDSGKTDFNLIQFDLKQICLEIIDIYYIDKVNHPKVITNFTDHIFTVNADRKLMEYSIFNILNNAFKYSEERKDVILNLFIKENMIFLEIIDSGIGIPKEDQLKLFNTFFRASNTNGIQGTGLGLYIAKTFIEKNSGTIQLESELGKGSKITLQFPFYKSEA